ncbi:MAG: ribonuclease P protein component [Eubacterium sp.]|nr:ribonuclease P protein component [Eubacterium sp.]
MNFARLGNNTEFQKVYRGGKSRANRYLVMYVLKDQPGPSRYGFSVSKKVGNSVQRHRVTRLLRESVRFHDSNVTSGNRVVIIARPEILGKELNEVSRSVEHLLRAHRIWRELSE